MRVKTKPRGLIRRDLNEGKERWREGEEWRKKER